MKKYIYLALNVIFIFSCNNDENIINPFINIDKNILNIQASGGEEMVNVSSNVHWTVEDVPSWCTIIQEDRNATNGSVEIKISPNETGDMREAKIKFFSASLTQHISIIQSFEKKENQIEWYTFPVNSFSKIEYTIGDNGSERFYNIKGKNIFINKAIENKVFLGNLIKDELKTVTDLRDYNQYTYLPITIGCFVNGKAFDRVIHPSVNELSNFANDIINSLPNQNLQFDYNNSPVKYTSYRQLHLLGKGNIGVNLDELISGYSYQEKEMSNKTGYIFSYNMKFFDIVMNMPNRIIEEDIVDENVLSSLSYISSISYGKTAYLIIESIDNEVVIKNIIEKIFKNKSLDTREKSIIDNAVSYYLCFNNKKQILVETGKLEVINKYVDSINEVPIIPLTFSALNYLDHSISTIDLQVYLP